MVVSKELIPLNRPDLLQAAGIPYVTEHQARWASRCSSQYGLSDAFVRIGRRVFIDADRFHELVRSASSRSSTEVRV